MVQSVTGVYNSQTGELRLNTVEKGTTNPRITYTGKMTDSGTVRYEGTYSNVQKGTQHTFDFAKL